jgi:GNAT superfamily N-acetyltransferase
VAVINEAYAVERFFVPGPRTDEAEVADHLARGAFLVAEEDRRIAGCVYVGRREGRGYFGLLSVRPGRQGRGLGRRLVEAAEERLRGEGFREVDILVVDVRRELFPFYDRLGYREVGFEPFPPEPSPSQACRFVVMRKSLTDG